MILCNYECGVVRRSLKVMFLLFISEPTENATVLSFFSSPTFLEIARIDGAIVKSTPFSN